MDYGGETATDAELKEHSASELSPLTLRRQRHRSQRLYHAFSGNLSGQLYESLIGGRTFSTEFQKYDLGHVACPLLNLVQNLSNSCWDVPTFHTFKSANRNWNFPQDTDFQARFISLNPPNLPPIFTVGLGLTEAPEVVQLFHQEDRIIEWISAPENPPDCAPRPLIDLSVSGLSIISPDWTKLSPDEQRILAPGQQSSWISQCMELTGLSTIDLADQNYIALSHLQAVTGGQFRSFGELLRHLHRHVKHAAVSLKISDDIAVQSALTICFQLILQTAIGNLDEIISCQLPQGVLLRRPPTNSSATSKTMVLGAENGVPAATDQNNRKEVSSKPNTTTVQAVPVNLSNTTSVNTVRIDNGNQESTNSINTLEYQSHVENATQTSSHVCLSPQNKATVSPRGQADGIPPPSLTPYWASQQKREPLLYRIEEERMSKTSQVRSLEDLCSPLGDDRAVCNLDPAYSTLEKNRPHSSCEIPTPDRFNSRSTFMSALSPNSNDQHSDDDEDLEIQQKPIEDTRKPSSESADDLCRAWLSIISIEHTQSPLEQNVNVSGDQTFDSLCETFIEQQKHPDVRGQLCKRIISRTVIDLISRCQCSKAALSGFVQSFHSQSVIHLTDELVDQVMAVTLTYRMNQMKFSSTEELSQLVATAPINVGLVIDQIMLENTASSEGFRYIVKTIKPPGYNKICRLCAELVDLIIESNPNLKPNFFDEVKRATSKGAVDALFSLAYPAACYAMNHVMQSRQTSPEVSRTTAGQINVDSEIDQRHSHSTQSEEKPTHNAATKSSSLSSQNIVTDRLRQTALYKELENAISLHSACSCVSESSINAVYTKITQLPIAASNQPLTPVTPVATAEEEPHSDQADESSKSVGWKTPQSSAEFVLEVSPSVKRCVDSKDNQMLPLPSASETDGRTEADEEKSCIVVSSTDGDCYSPHPVTGERFNASRIVRPWSFRSSRSDCPNDCSAAGSIHRSNPEHSLDPPNMSSSGYVQQESAINVHITFRLPDSSALGETALEPVRVRTQSKNASWKDAGILVDDGESGLIQFCPQCSSKLRTCIERPDEIGASTNITGSINITRDDGVQYELVNNEDKGSQDSIRVVPEDHGGREPSSLCDADCEIMRNLDRDLVNLSEDSSSTSAQKETHLVLECTVSKGPSPNLETREELDSSPSVVFRSLSMSVKDVRTKRRASCKSYSCSRLQNMNISDRANVHQTGDSEVYRDERTNTRSIRDEVDRTEDEVMIVAEGTSRTPTTEEEKTLSQGPQTLCYKGDETEGGPEEIADQSLVARKSRVSRGSKGKVDKRSAHFAGISPFYTCLEELRDCLRKAEERLSEVNSMSRKNPKFTRLRSRRKICARIVRRSPMKKRLKSRKDEKDLTSCGPSDENHYVSQVDLSEFRTQYDLTAQKHSSHPNLSKPNALMECASRSDAIVKADASPQTQKRGHKSISINKSLQSTQSSRMKRTPTVNSFHLRGPISYFPAPSMELPVRANMTLLNSLHQSFVDEYSHQFVRRVQQIRKTGLVNSNIIKVFPALTGAGEKAHAIGHIGAVLTHNPQHARSSCRLCSACSRDA